MKYRYLIATVDMEAFGTNDRGQARLYATNDENIVVDLEADVVINEDGETISEIKDVSILDEASDDESDDEDGED